MYRHPSSPGTALLPSSSDDGDGGLSCVVMALCETRCADNGDDDGEIVVLVVVVVDVTVPVDVDVDVAVEKVVTGGRRGVTLR